MARVSLFSRRGIDALLLLTGLALVGCGGSAESKASPTDASDAASMETSVVDGSWEADSAQADEALSQAGDSDAGPAGDANDESLIGSETGTDASPDVDAAAPPACSLPIAGTLTLPTAMVTGTLRGPSRNTTTSCTTDLGSQGPDAFYVLNVAQRTGVILQTTGLANTVLAIRSVCDDPTTEVACNHNGMPPNAYLRTILDPGTYYVVVDVYAFGIGGNYTLSLTTFTAPANGTCAGAVAVTNGAKVMGDVTLSAPSNLPSCAAGPVPVGGSTENALYYRATIPAGDKLIASVTGAPVEVSVLDTCSSSTCLAPASGRVEYANAGASGKDVILIVSEGPMPPPPPGGPMLTLPFELDVTVQPLAANAACAAPIAVSAGTTITGDTSLGGADTMTPCTSSTPNGIVSGPLWYSVTVPSGSALLINTQALDPSPMVVGVVDGCGSGAACLAPVGPGAMGPMGPGQLRYPNAGMSAKSVEFYVGHSTYGPGGRFSATASVVSLAANASCAAPAPLTDGVPVMGDTTSGSSATLPCVNGASGALFYSISVPAGMTLGVELPTMVQPGLSVAILDSCSASTCLGEFTSGPVPAAAFTNTSMTPRSVIVAVGTGFGGGAFTLTPSLHAAATNANCNAPTPVTNGTKLTFQDATVGVDNLSSRCSSSDTGGVVYYSATIGAGQVLTATATGTAAGAGGKYWVPSVRVLASCNATSCLASSNGMPPTATASYSNAGSSPINVLVAVGPSAMFGPPNGAGYFDLAVTIR